MDRPSLSTSRPGAPSRPSAWATSPAASLAASARSTPRAPAAATAADDALCWDSGQPAPRMVMARLLRQLLLDARARLAPSVEASAGAPSPTAVCLRTLEQALRALEAADPWPDEVMAGVIAAFGLLDLPSADVRPAKRPPFDYAYARSPEALTRHLGLAIDHTATRLLALPPVALVNANRVGRLLATQLQQMRPGEARYLALLGLGHMLALILRRRGNGHGEREGEPASVVCYDPQRPASHTHEQTASAQALRDLRLSPRLVSEDSRQQYFGASRPQVAAVYDLRQLVSPAKALWPLPDPGALWSRPDSVTTPQYLRMVMQVDSAGAMCRSLGRVKDLLGQRSAKALAERLARQPPLGEGIAQRRVHAVAAFVDGLLMERPLGPRPPLYVRLLADAQGAAGHAEGGALSLALHASPELAGLLTRKILEAPSASLGTEDKRWLLRDADARGAPLLHRLLARRAYPDQPPALPRALHAYGYEVVASTGLSRAEKLDLLLGQAIAPPALETGLGPGALQAWAAIACALHEAPTDPQTRAELLGAWAPSLRALGRALDLGEPEARRWASRILARVSRPGTDAAMSVYLRRAWAAVPPARDPKEDPALARRLAARLLRVRHTTHDDDAFRAARLRAFAPDAGGDGVFCVPWGEDPTALTDLDGWQVSAGRLQGQSDKRPPVLRPLYLLPASWLEPMALEG